MAQNLVENCEASKEVSIICYNIGRTGGGVATEKLAPPKTIEIPGELSLSKDVF
jgi:hypothetical protein